MRTPAELTDLFRLNGRRVTPQRQAVFRALTDNERHPTVESLYDAVRVEVPSISLRTVYQTVHDLADLGEVAVLDLGTGSQRVDPNVEHDHHHLVCTACGRVGDLPLEFTNLRVPNKLRKGFTVTSVEVVFRGVCADCSTPQEESPRHG